MIEKFIFFIFHIFLLLSPPSFYRAIVDWNNRKNFTQNFFNFLNFPLLARGRAAIQSGSFVVLTYARPAASQPVVAH